MLGVVDAADARQLHVALAQLAGGLAQPLDRLRNGLLDLLADLEARLDFAEEEVPPLAPGEMVARSGGSGRRRSPAWSSQMDSRQETAESVRVVLAGPPNSGKSSLFNALAGPARALVSDQPGTTRDYLWPKWTWPASAAN